MSGSHGRQLRYFSKTFTTTGRHFLRRLVVAEHQAASWMVKHAKSNPVREKIAHNSDNCGESFYAVAFYYAAEFYFSRISFSSVAFTSIIHITGTAVVKHRDEFRFCINASPGDSRGQDISSRNLIYTPHASLNTCYIVMQSRSMVLNRFPRRGSRRRIFFPPHRTRHGKDLRLLFRSKRVRVAVLLLRTLMAAIIMIGIFIAVRNNAEL